MAKFQRALIAAVAVIGGSMAVGRLLGYKLGLHTIARCRRGHVFETIWIPGIKLTSLDLVVARVQRCPVGKHWTIIVPLKTSAITDTDRELAAHNRDMRIP